MPLLAENDKLIATIQGRLFNQVILSTFHYRATGLMGDTDMNAALDALSTELGSVGNLIEKYLDCCAPEYELENLWLQVIAPTRFAKRTYDDHAAIGGFATGEYRVSNVAAVILRRGSLADRSNVSTLHVPIGQSANEVSEGSIVTGLFLELEALADQVLVDVTTAAPVVIWKPVIVHPGTPMTYTDIDFSTVNTTTRVMRRRTVGLGI